MPAATGSRRVVAGVDGSPNSVSALHRAAAEARRRQASLEVVLVIPGEPDPEAYAAGLEMLAELLIREYPHGTGVPVQRVVEHGDPARTLTGLARGAELLALGACRCRSGHLLGGDVVPACLTWATCPVAICAHEGQRATV